MSDKSEKKRFSVTLTTAYVEAMDELIEVGVYLDLQDVIRDALRQLFKYHKLQPFCPELVEEVEEKS